MEINGVSSNQVLLGAEVNHQQLVPLGVACPGDPVVVGVAEVDLVQRYLLYLLVADPRLPIGYQLLRVAHVQRDRARSAGLPGEVFCLGALIEARRRQLLFLYLIIPLLSFKVMDLVQLRSASTDELEPPVPLVCPLDLDGCVDLPLYPDPELRIPLLYLTLQSRILLLQRPMLQAHGFHPILLVHIGHEFLCKKVSILPPLDVTAHRRLQTYGCILLDRQIRVLYKD